MNIEKGTIEGLRIIRPRRHSDTRGWFSEIWSEARYREAGLGEVFVQDNLSCSARHVLRGLHFQNPNAQGKLVMVLKGEVWDVAVDLRRSSPTFGRWEGICLSAEDPCQFYIPPGFAHGFVVLTETALFLYKCTAAYSPKDEVSLRWDDPDLGIRWPVSQPIVSPKDAAATRLRDLSATQLFA